MSEFEKWWNQSPFFNPSFALATIHEIAEASWNAALVSSSEKITNEISSDLDRMKA